MFKEVNQITLSASNDKGIQSIDPIGTHAYRTSKNLACKREQIKWNKITQKSLILIALQKKT